MRLFDEDAWWQWILEQVIRGLIGLGLRAAWRRLRGIHRRQGEQGADRDPGNRPGQERTGERRDE